MGNIINIIPAIINR